MAEQLSFPQPHRTSYAAADFFPGEASAVARAMLRDPENWPFGKLILAGDAGAGKTHLLTIWAETQGGTLVAGDIPSRADGPLAVDDAHLFAGDAAAEEALFHLHNNMAEAQQPLLLSARGAPSTWGINLPDLRSRMEATTVAHIAEPDDATLQAILMKLLADRQLDPDPRLGPFLLARMGRSYAEAARVVEALDSINLAEKRRITPAIAARVLDAATD